jgi:DNA-directed RNA polymerase specialized sigma24 family protein
MLRARFGAYFPRVFAFLHSLLGDEEAARDLVIETFATAFADSKDVSENEFPVLLFSVAHKRCRDLPARSAGDDGLSAREKEVVSLIFDAQLTRQEVGQVLGMTQESVASALLQGLKKLRVRLGSRASTAFLGLSS